ncbi:MAG: IclR family transcriptional regulator, partial [Betaproteobacteria bacterium]|nr:IclR family transcriptional regulator [Betaproteobacteria bacterium]
MDAGRKGSGRRVEPGSPGAAQGGDERQFVTALARGLEVLACFRSRDRALGNQDIARRCALPKSTVSRLTYTLTRLGYLSQDEDSGRYRLGSATLALGSSVLARMDMRQLARPWMQQLADATGTMVSLGLRDRLSMIYVENCRSPSALTLSLDVGSRIPLGSSAMGRAWLAAAPEAERASLLEELAAQEGEHWPQLRAGIERSLREQRELGCACSFGDWQPDVNAIAVAVEAGPG